MLGKISMATMLNLGSLATFAAFPMLYSAVYGGGTGVLVGGMALMVFSMLAPFVALKCKQ